MQVQWPHVTRGLQIRGNIEVGLFSAISELDSLAEHAAFRRIHSSCWMRRLIPPK